VVAPFEFAITFQPQRFLGGKNSTACLGGGATTGFRLAASLQLIADVGGCKMMGLEKDLSGDSLTYLVGPRWTNRIRGSWSAYLQFLAGGAKITEERMDPELKQHLEKNAIRDNKLPHSHDDYTEATERHGFAVATGGGLSYNLSSALSLRVADLTKNDRVRLLTDADQPVAHIISIKEEVAATPEAAAAEAAAAPAEPEVIKKGKQETEEEAEAPAEKKEKK